MDFYFDNAAPLIFSGAAEKQQGNIAAIRIMKECRGKQRSATPEEQAVLARYVGWGDSTVLRALRENAELRTILTDDEMKSALGSSLNAHFTSLPVIRAMWDALLHLGLGNLPSMRILDPSAGIGHFKSLTPVSLQNKAEWVEIELDELTSAILQLLHPTSRIYPLAFEKVSLPDGWFDLAISNVPFGNYPVISKAVPEFSKKCIHDFFFANSVRLLRPGGVLAFITSRFTMDKKDCHTRTWLARHMDLLAAVRLPNTAFKANAGTEVVTDVLFLQKRTQELAGGASWAETKPFRMGYYREAQVNQYYLDHPEVVLGEPSMNGSMYQSDGYTVEPDERDLAEAMRACLLAALPAGCIKSVVNAAEIQGDSGTPVVITTAEKTRSADAEKRVQAMHEIYRLAKSVLAFEMQDKSLFETSEVRHKLNRAYDDFTMLYGPINKPANTKLIEGSVEGPFLKALELYDRLSATAQKAGIFSGPTVRGMRNAIEAPSVADALLICLDKLGRVDIPVIAAASSVDQDEVIQQLGNLVYQEPATGRWLTADEYLSGNVREKLVQARAAANMNSNFERNILALEVVQPIPLKPTEIRAPFGAGWVPPQMVEDFVIYLLEGGSPNADYVAGLAHWELECWDAWRLPNGPMYSRWGTPRMSALELIQCGLNAQTPVVYDMLREGDSEKQVVNHAETMSAQMKLAAIKTEWEKWLWSDIGRAETLASIYNERYNAHRVRRYDGQHLTIPGLNLAISPRPQQKNGLWRILQNQETFIAWEVGMGKTLLLIMAIMESKRLGMTKKAVVCVPNHLVAQWHAQILWAYPNANTLLVTAADLSKGKRGEFMSRIATNDWDIVIVPFSSFKLLPVKPETLEQFYQEQIDQLRDYLEELKASDSSSRATKEIQRAIKRFEVKLARCGDMAKDAVGTITWEELGVDFLGVDEFNSFKNLFFSTKMTRIAGLPNSDSQRAFDMFIKVRQILGTGGKVVGMTGTPVTNTIAELFTMQRFFQLEKLEELGLSHFDAWASQFALAEPGLEMTPDGAGFRMNTRFRKFVNVPELMTIWGLVADTKRIDGTTGIERPTLYGGKPVKVASDGGEILKEYTQSLGDRAARIHSGVVRPEEDNMLKVSSDGRKAALDMSLVCPALPGASMPKIDSLVELVAQIYTASTPTKGAQLIFCDLATPKAKS